MQITLLTVGKLGRFRRAAQLAHGQEGDLHLVLHREAGELAGADRRLTEGALCWHAPSVGFAAPPPLCGGGRPSPRPVAG